MSTGGEFVDLVDSALKENVEKARLRVETALASARQEFDKRFGALDDPTRQAMFRVIEAGYKPEKYDEQLLDCPACDTPALVVGSVKVEMDEDWTTTTVSLSASTPSSPSSQAASGVAPAVSSCWAAMKWMPRESRSPGSSRTSTSATSSAATRTGDATPRATRPLRLPPVAPGTARVAVRGCPSSQPIARRRPRVKVAARR